MYTDMLDSLGTCYMIWLALVILCQPLAVSAVRRMLETVGCGRWQGLVGFSSLSYIHHCSYVTMHYTEIVLLFVLTELTWKSIFFSEKVAIKILDKTKLDQKTQRLLSREISSMEKLHHPNIIRLYEVVETLSKLHLVMEYAGGGELFTKITTEGKLIETECKIIFSQIVSAVKHMVSKLLFHGHVSPHCFSWFWGCILFFQLLSLLLSGFQAHIFEQWNQLEKYHLKDT